MSVGAPVNGDVYRVVDLLGRGGFGVTYRAVDTGLERPVAIKEFFPRGAAVRVEQDGPLVPSPPWQERFARGLDQFAHEGRILGGLSHPNIVQVLYQFRERGTAYLVMELIDGVTLLDELDGHPERRLPEVRVIAVVDALVGALDTAHARQVWHLDIKPANVLVEGGRVVLADFGAARRALGGDGLLAYTPGYAPPELVAGSPVGPETDLYELATLAHELLTGRLPRGGSLDGVPSSWRPALAVALEPEPAERPRNVRAWWERYRPDAARGEWRGRPTFASPPHPRGAGVPIADGRALRDAVAGAPAGTVIRLAPGRYDLAEPLVLARPLTLEGAGMHETELVAEAGECVLRCTGGGAFVLADLGLRWAGAGPADVVVADCAGITVERCRVAGAVSRTIDLRAGLRLGGTVRARVIGCVAETNRGHGVYLEGEAQAELEANVCRDNTGGGITFTRSAGGTARRNSCTANARDGITVAGQAAPTLVGNELNHNRRDGIGYSGSAAGLARANTCQENLRHGVHATDQAHPLLEENRLIGNAVNGLYVGVSAWVRRRGNEVRNNRGGDWGGPGVRRVQNT